MSGFTAINLDQLPPPEIVRQVNFEDVLADLKADLVARDPALADVVALESEPTVKLLEAFAYHIMLKRTEVNDDARQVMLAFATGANLDHLAANYKVERLVVTQAQPGANPPIAQVMESDDRLRKRVQLSPEGRTTAGPRGSYRFHALSASGQVKDVGISSPRPVEVVVTVLSVAGDGTADQALLDQVSAALNDEDVRPLTDKVIVQSAAIINYTIDATLTFYDGPDAQLVRAAAMDAIEAFVTDHHAIGHDITLSGIYRALHQPGVQKVTLAAPLADIVIDAQQAAYCTQITVNAGGRDA